MSQMILISDSKDLLGGCFVCGAYHWDCTVDGCQPRGGNRPGDVIHCKICNTVYVVEPPGAARRPRPRPRSDA
jgi:hypothetical protein